MIGYRPALDGLRDISVLVVAVFHSGDRVSDRGRVDGRRVVLPRQRVSRFVLGGFDSLDATATTCSYVPLPTRPRLEPSRTSTYPTISSLGASGRMYAMVLGLIPDGPLDRASVGGNAAGNGAVAGFAETAEKSECLLPCEHVHD